MTAYLQGVIIPIICAEDVQWLNHPVLEEEIVLAIVTMKINKDPGPDGFTLEFYKKFKLQVTALTKQVFEYCIQVKSIPESWQTAKIIIIPQKGKDPAKPESYHLIPLLNVDYKILSSILSIRLRTIIEFYIHKEKKGLLISER